LTVDLILPEVCEMKAEYLLFSNGDIMLTQQ
jgi:hypothetical protein